MSDDESQHDPLQTEGGEISAANGSREVENVHLPLGSEETGENDESVAARIRLRRQRQQAADADILGPLQTGGGEISVANGSDTAEVDQSELPSWAAALTAQMQQAFTVQLAAQAQDHKVATH